VAKSGEERVYESVLLRRTYRDGGKVKHETLANLAMLPPHVIDTIDAALKGTQLVAAGEAVTITRSLPHGHVAAVAAMAHKLGLPSLLGPAGRDRDLALALIISRVVTPKSKLSTLTWWPGSLRALIASRHHCSRTWMACSPMAARRGREGTAQAGSTNVVRSVIDIPHASARTHGRYQ
jgi:hypothetical protein